MIHFIFATTTVPVNRREYYQSMWHPGDVQCSNLRRFGNTGDGGKFVCLDRLDRDNLEILSIGSKGDFSFESALHTTFPFARITVMDGTVSKDIAETAPTYLRFRHQNFNENTYFTSNVNILKIDCEGCEKKSLLPFLRDKCVDQILIETHACLRGHGNEKYHALLSTLNQTYGVFMKEPNIQWSDGSCVEFAFLRRLPCR